MISVTVLKNLVLQLVSIRDTQRFGNSMGFLPVGSSAPRMPLCTRRGEMSMALLLSAAATGARRAKQR